MVVCACMFPHALLRATTPQSTRQVEVCLLRGSNATENQSARIQASSCNSHVRWNYLGLFADDWGLPCSEASSRFTTPARTEVVPPIRAQEVKERSAVSKRLTASVVAQKNVP